PPHFTDHQLRNNGLDLIPIDLGVGEVTGTREDEGLFKTTSLRNISVTAPYMHDSRFATLEDVLDFYAEGVQVNAENIDSHMQPWIFGNIALDQQDRADIVAFLHTLTDQDFLTNPAFADPN
nr:cytochrome-c peroxidase [Bacteroidota bacterium]